MTVEFKLPELGENITSGTIVTLLIKAGDMIEKDQGLLELETDKAVIEVPSEIAGKVLEVKVKEGEEVTVGQTVLLMEEVAVAVEETASPSPEEPEKVEPSKPQAAKQKPEAVATEVHADITEIKVPAAEIQAVAVKQKEDPVPAAPSVRRFAREIGIDINMVPGIGPGGRISIEDVKTYSKMINKQKTASDVILKGVDAELLPDFSRWGSVKREAMTKVRETTAKHLSYAWATIPHVTNFDKADITGLEKLRKQFAPKVEAAGGKLTVTTIMIKIIEKALKKFPQFNASIDMLKKEIIYKDYYNIGVAVNTDRGLLVPVLKNVERKNIIELSVELTELSQKARDRKLTLEEMQGGNFSISNLGGIGGTGFSPIINSPEVAIIGLSRSAMEPVYRDGSFEPRLMLPLSLSYDHRLIDGADAAFFLRWLKEVMEEPFLISLEG